MNLTRKGYELYEKINTENSIEMMDFLTIILSEYTKRRKNIINVIKKAVESITFFSSTKYFFNDFKVINISQENDDFKVVIQTSPFGLEYTFFLKLDGKVPYFEIEEEKSNQFMNLLIEKLNSTKFYKELFRGIHVVEYFKEYFEIINMFQDAEIDIFDNLILKFKDNMAQLVFINSWTSKKEILAVFDFERAGYVCNDDCIIKNCPYLLNQMPFFLNLVRIDNMEILNFKLPFDTLKVSGPHFQQLQKNEYDENIFLSSDKPKDNTSKTTYLWQLPNGETIELNKIGVKCVDEEKDLLIVVFSDDTEIKIPKTNIMVIHEPYENKANNARLFLSQNNIIKQ